MKEIYKIRCLTEIFLKYRRELWQAHENDLKHNLKPRLKGEKIFDWRDKK